MVGMPIETPYCRKEERANAATHGVGFLCAVVGGAVVVSASVRHGGAWEVTGCAIYAVTLVALYAASTLSHVFHKPRLRHAMRVADQAAIYLFIAGSFAPIAMTWLHSGLWWVLHVSMWAVALIGFNSKVFFTHNVRQGSVSGILYLMMGWMPILAAWPLVKSIPIGLSVSLIAGGLCYTLGMFFFYYDTRIRYFHAAWHTMVTAGSVCHFIGILLYCTTSPA